ncbi:hypothetical protein L207DRAFT_635433 [Hyaloscypha variabilis F]|uniref:2EXR domain-containing protein n=1 Tax=Hyaloscypha variabilis (strain UAMH 11265 / GT02V1 / F) TaxID=1149755 RepID=A0A2J6RHM0_HYAVF|nr:hypothetical protein L207DRAFT_635433 [Hyaloscypha variabilis F]
MLIDPTATGTLTEMEKFPKFPPEIRFEIWRLTFAPRRAVLDCISDPKRRPRASLRSHEALLLVNREAHKIFLEHHGRILEDDNHKGFYFNFYRDMLRLVGSAAQEIDILVEQYPEDMECIESLEIPADLLTRDPNDWDYILYEMPDLYYITIIATSISHSELVAHVRRLYSRHHGRTLFGRLRFAMGRFGICDGQPNYEVVLQCWGPQSLWLKESVKRYLDMEYFLKYLGQE